MPGKFSNKLDVDANFEIQHIKDRVWISVVILAKMIEISSKILFSSHDITKQLISPSRKGDGNIT